MFRTTLAIAAAASLGFASAYASPINVDPGIGPSAIEIDEFDTDNDVFNLRFDLFDIEEPLVFQNGGITRPFESDANVIVLREVTGGGNPSFNARSAARVIAGNTEGDRDGFFVYWNEGLSINRLVYSANLNDGEAALDILVAVLDPTGATAIQELANFSVDNFTETPLPAGGLLIASALGGLGFLRRKSPRRG